MLNKRAQCLQQLLVLPLRHLLECYCSREASGKENLREQLLQPLCLSLLLSLFPLSLSHTPVQTSALQHSLVWKGKCRGAERPAALCCAPRRTA